MTKQETLPKGAGLQNLTSPKHLEINYFHVLYHQYSITYHSESILKPKIMSILMIVNVFVFFLSDLLRNILKCNCSPYSTLMKMYLPGAILYTIQWHSSMHEVHLVKGHVVYVYWIDIVYVQNNLPTEINKMTVFII